MPVTTFLSIVTEITQMKEKGEKNVPNLFEILHHKYHHCCMFKMLDEL